MPEIENRLGWLTVADQMLEQAPDLEAFAQECRDEGFTDAVLLGMGGSSLGPEVIRRSFGEIPGGLRLHVLDSTDPDTILAVQESLDLEKTLFVVSSKSGATIETLSQYRHFKTLAGPQQFVVVTDLGSPLEQLASDDGLRRCFLNPSDIGGRYSVLSYFGLVPAALMGVNIEALLHGCQVAEQMCAHYDSSRVQLRTVARGSDRRARAAGPRQADVPDLRGDRELRTLGRAARRRVHGQTGEGHPPRRRRAGRRAQRVRR